MKILCKKILISLIVATISTMGFTILYDGNIKAVEDESGYTALESITDLKQEGNVINITYRGGEKSKITFLEEDIFRFQMEPTGEFSEYPEPANKNHAAKITQQPDSSNEYTKPKPKVSEEGQSYIIATNSIALYIQKNSALMKLVDLKGGNTIWEESAPLKYKSDSTVQTLKENPSEYFFGGGTQNGRFSHKGKKIAIQNTNVWIDSGVASPNPFYWSTQGYAIMRNTFKQGSYDFGSLHPGTVTTTHSEKRFDAYYMAENNPTGLLQDYYKITGNPALYPEYSFYIGHLNCYSRDAWAPATKETSGAKLLEDGNYYKETNRSGATQSGETLETLNGSNVFSAQSVVNGYVDNDMPLGWFLPNDGYGCGYGRENTLDGNIENLKEFSDYAEQQGIITGLWTQSQLTPDPSVAPYLQRDFKKEVGAGVKALKTDVAWVGAGYSFGLNGIKTAYDIMGEQNIRPGIVTLDGWAGTQRYGGIWTGDQSGGEWEYIRFHIPTYIGTGLSGQPNIGSDWDGIFGGSALIQNRDIQWKAFTPLVMNMDGWGKFPKKPYIFGDETDSINRMYLKLKAEMMPYTYTLAHEATNGLPMVRAMFLEYPNEYTYSSATQYQYMYGENLLVAPIYENTNMNEKGDDVRNDIYLPDENQIWIDYFTGKQYYGGANLNNFDAPVWKLPLFVKNGAIIPMYEENNNPQPISSTNEKGLDKTKRVIEFYPSGNTEFTVYEDDGMFLDNSNKEEVHYGGSATTNITSKQMGNEAILEIAPTKGSYQGYDANRITTMVVNVSKKPSALEANIGETMISLQEVTSQEDFDKATGNVYFYNEKPNLNKYGTDGFKEVEIITTPKMYVKLAKTDVSKNAIKLTVHGFENKQDISKNEENEHLQTPVNFKIDEENVTPSAISLFWSEVEHATSYDLEEDGIIQTNIVDTKYIHKNLSHSTTHTYRVRARNANGYSKWSEPLQGTTAVDPYRNVVKNLDIKVYQKNGTILPEQSKGEALANLVDGDEATMYHSIYDSTQVVDYIDIDLNNMYSLDKIEYLPRSNAGNGNITNLDILISIDGKNWKTVQSNIPWARDNALKIYDFVDKTTSRYVRLKINSSVGGYCSGLELRIYAEDPMKAKTPGDYTNDGKVNEDDLTFLQNYTGLKMIDSDWSYVAEAGADINYDNIIDAYDISYVTRMLNGGTIKTGSVSGKMLLIPDKEHVKAGEEVTYQVYGINMQNVNAFGIEIPLDIKNFEYMGVEDSIASQFMQSFSTYRTHSDGQANIYSIYANQGDQELLSGSTLLSTIKLKAKKDTKTTIIPISGNFIGPDLDRVDALEKEDKPEHNKPDELVAMNDMNMKVSGEDESVLQKNMGVDKLIDGKVGADAYRFEFKWGDSEASVPARLPYEIMYTFNELQKVADMRIQVRADGANLNEGALKDFEIYGLLENGSKELILTDKIIQKDTTFTLNNKQYKGIVLKAITSQGGKKFKLNIDETTIHVKNKEADVNVTEIKLDEHNEAIVYEGNTIVWKAQVFPEDATNANYTLASSDENIAVVEPLYMNGETLYIIKGMKEGTITMTATSESNSDVTTTAKLVVKPGVNISLLEEVLQEAKSYQKTDYEEESYANLVHAIQAGQIALTNKESQQKVDQAIMNIRQAIVNLKYKNIPLATLIHDPNMKVISATNHADKDVKENIIDKNADTIWHSSYSANAKLPVDVVVDLGDVYTLDLVQYLPRQTNHNGHITKYRLEVSLDGKNFEVAKEGTLSNNGYELDNKSEFKDIRIPSTKTRYVKLVALETLGDTMNKYASIAELQFFGEKSSDMKVTSIKANPSALDLVIGDYTQIEIIFAPVGASAKLTWISSNPDVVNVVDGKVSATKAGKATIRAVVNDDVYADIPITVTGANKEQLQALVDEYAAQIETIENSKIKLSIIDQIGVAKIVLNNEKATMREIATAYTTLKTVDDSIALDKEIQRMYACIETYKQLDLSYYDGDKEAFKTALITASIDLDTVKQDPFNQQALLVEIEANVIAAKEQLVKIDVISLQEAIDKAEALDLKLYVNDEHMAAFKTTMAAAKQSLIDHLSQQDIDNAQKALAVAMSKLQLKATTEQKTQLQKYVDLVDSLDKEMYTEDANEAIQKLYDDIKAALANQELSMTNAQTYILQIADVKTEYIYNNDAMSKELMQQTVTSTDGKITISGMLPRGVQILGAKLSEKEMVLLVNSIQDKTIFNKLALESVFNIELTRNGVTYTPEAKLTVAIQLDENVKQKQLGIAYIDATGKVEELDTKEKEDSIVFSTTHFSHYAIVSYLPQDATKPNGASTYDATNIILWMSLLSMSGFVFIYLHKKKKRMN